MSSQNLPNSFPPNNIRMACLSRSNRYTSHRAKKNRTNPVTNQNYPITLLFWNIFWAQPFFYEYFAASVIA